VERWGREVVFPVAGVKGLECARGTVSVCIGGGTCVLFGRRERRWCVVMRVWFLLAVDVGRRSHWRSEAAGFVWVGSWVWIRRRTVRVEALWGMGAGAPAEELAECS
jgi:hypothetical protein